MNGKIAKTASAADWLTSLTEPSDQNRSMPEILDGLYII